MTAGLYPVSTNAAKPVPNVSNSRRFMLIAP
jgi:hypothetical protein